MNKCFIKTAHGYININIVRKHVMAYRQEYEISIPSKDLPNKTSEEEEYVSRARHQPAEPPSLDIKTSNGEEYMFREFSNYDNN